MADAITFEAGTTTHFTGWSVDGSGANQVTINSSDGATAHYLVADSGGPFTSTYVTISHSHVSPDDQWEATTGSVDVVDNEGWFATLWYGSTDGTSTVSLVPTVFACYLAAATGEAVVSAPGSYIVTTLAGAIAGTSTCDATWVKLIVWDGGAEGEASVLWTTVSPWVGAASGTSTVVGDISTCLVWDGSVAGTSDVTGILFTGLAWSAAPVGTSSTSAHMHGRLHSLLVRGNMSELVYRQGGTLQLDEPFTSQPTSATITIRTLDNKALSTLDSTLVDIEDAVCDCDDLVLTFAAANEQARVLSPTATVAGTVPTMTSPGYRLLINRGGRIYFTQVNEFDTQVVLGDLEVTSIRLDSPIPFALKAGDTGRGIRVAYTVDWAAVTSEFSGQVKATWKVTVDGEVRKIVRIYDVVKQILFQPAVWADVLAVRPDADTQLSHVADKEQLVTAAWNTIKQDLYTLGIRHNLIISDEATTLRDAVVLQTLYNLTLHSGLPVPPSYNGLGDSYLDRLQRDRERAMSLLQMPVDENEDEIVSASEKQINRRSVFFRSGVGHRGNQ